MTDELIVVANARVMGRLVQGTQAETFFVYDQSWRSAPDAFPLSLSMPLVDPTHGRRAVTPFLWGLLPDNPDVLTRWAKQFQVSPRNAFALISHVGEDCAGAVQFVRPGRVDDMLAAGPEDVAWLDDADIAARLRALRLDHGAWRAPQDTGQFSLAGAQPKTALLFENGRWGVPSGRTPTTHILKPPTGQFDGHAENEHLCLRLAKRLGMIVPRSNVVRFEDEVAIVVERYDRRRMENSVRRVHQEDMCQAMAVPPTSKYENDGGPGAFKIATLLRAASTRPEEDVWRFFDALAFNWLIGGTDAHAKNYSLLIGRSGAIRFAPLYDLASYLPYSNDVRKIRMAMKIGGDYRLHDIGQRSWSKLAAGLQLHAEEARSRLLAMARRMPESLSETRDEIAASGLKHPIVDRLVDLVEARSRRCAAGLDVVA